MTPYNLRKAAEDMGISYPSAVHMRIRYLVSQIERYWMWAYEEGNMPEIMLKDAHSERTALVRSLKTPPKGEVTPDMIERARSVPMGQIIEFRNGRATAWCHEDKRPSLYIGTRCNIVICPVCDLKFDAISVQMAVTGQTFRQAVLELCG